MRCKRCDGEEFRDGFCSDCFYQQLEINNDLQLEKDWEVFQKKWNVKVDDLC